jgi:hypothetical protein
MKTNVAIIDPPNTNNDDNDDEDRSDRLNDTCISCNHVNFILISKSQI